MEFSAADAYLNSDDLRILTGWCHKAKQQAWLKAHRWPFEVSGTGRILVLREYHRKRLFGSREADPITAFATPRHNFSAIA